MLLLVLLLAGSPSPSPGGCAQAISADNAQKLFAAIKDAGGDCKLEEVRTEGEVMRVEWRKNGVPAPLIEIRPSLCGPGSTVTGPEFAMSAPAGAGAACPAAVEKMKALIATESFGGAVRLGTPAESRRSFYAALAGGAAVLLAIAAVVVWRRRRKT